MQEVVDEIKLPQLFCIGLKKARMVCISPQCQNNAFMCLDQECKQCQKNHSQCQSYRVNVLINQIKKKQQAISNDVQDSIKAMERIYQEAIDRLSKDKEALLDQMDMYGLNENEAQFFRVVLAGNQEEVNGKMMARVMQTLQDDSKFVANEQNLNRYWNSKKLEFEKIFDHFKIIWKRRANKIGSEITDNVTLIQSFFDKPIINFKLLYRASQNNFQVNKFHALCDGKQNTLVLAQTEHGKIVGGFTGLKWNSSSSYVQDYTNSTFIFSITNSEKYTLKNQQYAIMCQSNYGPTFGGGHDMYIANDAKNANSSYSNFGHSYNTNGKCQASTQQAYTYFSGSPSGYNTRYTEWEVFELQF